jgi:hypothetical protein
MVIKSFVWSLAGKLRDSFRQAKALRAWLTCLTKMVNCGRTDGQARQNVEIVFSPWLCVGGSSVEGSDRTRRRLGSNPWNGRGSVRFVKYGAICYPAGRNGPAPSIRGRAPASMGAADSSTARETWAQSARFRKASQLLVDGDFSMGTGSAEAAGGLLDCDGKDGWTAGRMVFLEDGGHPAE